MNVVSLHIFLGSVQITEEFNESNPPMITATVFVAGLGVLNHPVPFSNELLDRIKAEVFETTRQRLGILV